MLQKPSECEGCPLHTIGKGFLKSEGLCNLKVAIIGEAAGKREMWEGLPFRPNAESGSLLEKVFKMCKVSRRDFVLYNIVNCHPPNDYLLGAPWEEGAIEHCRQHLEKVLNKYRPNAILALGNMALQALTGYTGIMDFRGYCFPSRYGIPVVGGLHPAYIRRGKSQFTPALVLDLLKAIRVSKGTWNEHIGNPTYLYPNYCEHPSIDEAIAFRNRVFDNSNLLLTYDIENPETAEASEDEREDFTFNEVTQIQFSLGKREGIAFPWEEPYIQIAKEILASDNNKSGHNCWFYDNKVLKQLYGIEVKGRVDDTMWMFHHLYPDLELGLQKVASFCDFPFPWKHLVASQFEFYGCFTGETRVCLADGSYIQFSKLFRQIKSSNKCKELDTQTYDRWAIKLGGNTGIYVKGMNDKGELIDTEVVGIKREVVKNQKWLKIRTEATDQAIYCTPDHTIYTVDGIKEAKDITANDLVYINKLGSSDLLHGTLLGDGSVDHRGRFRIGHCLQQRDWLEAKRQSLNGPIYEDRLKEKEWKRGKIKQVNPSFKTEVWVSKTLWRDRFYPKGKKIFIPPPSYAALAVWYCDDGTYSGGKLIEVGNPRIVIQGFPNKQEIIEWFIEQYGIFSVSVVYDKRMEGDDKIAAVSLKGEGKYKFFNDIHSYVHPSMYRKLPKCYQGKYNGWLEHKVCQLVKVIEVCSYDPPSDANTLYCLTVKDKTHRFFVMGGLVGNCADVDSPQWIISELPERLKKRGVWEGYEDKVRGFYTVLTNIEDRGVGVDPIARGKFKEELETELERIYAEAQTKAPIEILNSKQKGGYKKTPKEVERLIQRYEYYSNKFASEGKVIKNTLDEYIFKQLSIVDSKGDTLHYVKREFEVGGPEKCKCLNKRTKLYKEKQETGICETCNNTGEVEKESKRVEVRWCLLKPFLPTSSQQVIRYIKYKAAQDKAKGIKKTKHIVPETLKDKRETTSKDELKRLALSTGDEMYKLIVEYREYNKMLKTDVPNWEPGKDGRVHTSFTFKPATGQLSSRNPNIQNAPKHQKLAKAFRAMIVPSDKRVLAEYDYSGFHVVMTGLEAGSKDYVRIAKIDMHSFVTSFLIKQPMRFDMSDEELKDRCKWIKEQTSKNPEGIKHGNMYLKEIRDLKAKPAILGIGFGLGATKLWHMNRESINNIAEAKYLLDLIKDLFPAVFRWQNAVRKEAHEKTFLMSRWGFTRNFFDVYRWAKNKFGKWEYKPGLDSEKAIAFLPANDAFGMVRWVMKKLEAMRCNARFKLVNTVHDSLVYEPKIKDLDLCCEVVPRVMQKPCPILTHPVICPDGITVEVETSVGENWSKDSLMSLEKWKEKH